MTATLLRILVVGLAAYRLARAIAVDDITRPVRRWLHAGAYGPAGDLTPDGWSFWAWAYALCSCPFCCGFWISLGLYGAWVNWSWSRTAIAAVAVAGACSIFVTFDRGLARE